MPERKPDQPKEISGLMRSVQAFVRKRDETRNNKQLVKTSDTRKFLEIQLMISEVDNILLKMGRSDPAVKMARTKLLELKNIISKTLNIE